METINDGDGLNRLIDPAEQGKITFMLIKGHSEVHQSIIIPKIHDLQNEGHEIFAIWKPKFTHMSDQFFTDANGMDLVKR